MKETIDLLGKILTNILTALYEPFGFSLLLSFLAMFFYLYAYEPIHAGKGWKNAIVTWYQKFKESVFFRKLFFLAFVTSLILFRTLLNVKPSAVDESFIRCHGWLGHLGDCEWRTEADHRVHRERNYDGAVLSSSDVDIRRKDWKQLEEDTVAKREDSILLFGKH